MKEFEEGSGLVFLGVILVLLVLVVAIAVRACEEDREPEYVVIALEDIRICGYLSARNARGFV